MFAPHKSLFRHPTMRLTLLGLVAPLFALPLGAQVSHVAQSTVTLSVTYSHPGDTKVSGPNSSDRVTLTTPLVSVRYANADLVRSLIPESESIKGWTLVAVWADWPEAGNSYRFFLRKKVSGGYEIRDVDPARLSLSLRVPYVARDLRRASEEIVSGTERFKALSRATLGADTVTRKIDGEETELSLSPCIADGMLGGTGRYAKANKSSDVIYLPGAVSFLGYGVADNNDETVEGEEADDVVSASIRLGASTFVPASQYSNFLGVSPAPSPSRGPESTTNDSDL